MSKSASAAVAATDRRLGDRLLAYWRSLRGRRRWPAYGDFRMDAVAGLEPRAFVLAFTPRDGAPVFRFIGAAAARACGADLTGRPVTTIARGTLPARITDHYLQVLTRRRPVAFEGTFVDESGAETPYRSIMLPFGDDDATVDHIVGILSESPPPSETMTAPPPRVHDGARLAATPDLAESLEECRGLARAVVAAESRSHEALYRALEGVYAFAMECEARPGDYAALLAAAGLRAQKRAPFTPVLKLVFGPEYDKTRLSEYAAALAHAKRHNQIAVTVKDFIESHEGGIKGCVRAERAARRAERGRAAGFDPARVLRALPRLGHVAADPGEDEFVLLVGRRADSRPGVDVVAVLREKGTVLETILKRAARACAKPPATSRDQ